MGAGLAAGGAGCALGDGRLMGAGCAGAGVITGFGALARQLKRNIGPSAIRKPSKKMTSQTSPATTPKIPSREPMSAHMPCASAQPTAPPPVRACANAASSAPEKWYE